MIPKVIHYCWFGGKPLPNMAKKCIASWRRYMPEYEIKRWDESNFDVAAVPYTSQAYAAKKYAFVSDYARFWILYHYGGVYFDTDVEVIRPMEDIIMRGNFMGSELDCDENRDLAINPGLGFGAIAGLDLIKRVLDSYVETQFVLPDGSLNLSTIVERTTGVLREAGLCRTSEIQRVGDIWIYPKEYFCPMNDKNGEICITSNSYSIHHFMDSWHTPFQKFKMKIVKIIGLRGIKIYSELKKFLRK